MMNHVVDYCDKVHPSIVLQTVTCFYKSKELCDVTLVVEDEEIKVHKIVLAASSLYFRTMFCGSLMESRQDKIVLHDMDLKYFKQILNFMYTGRIEITEENIHSVISMADFLQITALSFPCCQYLQSILCVDNCLSIYQTASANGYNDLTQEAMCCILSNFSSICEQSEFAEIGIELLTCILSSDYISIEDEGKLLEVIVRWMKYNIDDRAKHVPMIPKMICLEEVPMEKLISLKIDPSISGTELYFLLDGCIDKILSNRYDDPEQNAIDSEENMRCKRFRYHSEQQVILVIGGITGGRYTCASVECFAPGFSQWSHHLPGHKRCIKSMHCPRSSFASALKDHEVYVIGGRGVDGVLDTAEKYCVKSNSWILLQNLKKPVEGATAAIVNGKLIVTGGRSTAGCESSVWAFDGNSNNWQQLKSMKYFRAFHCTVSVGGMVYVLGGLGGASPSSEASLTNVERLDTSQTAWYEMAPMMQARSHFGSVVSGNLIYVAGGSFDGMYLRCVERYNTLTDTWCVLKEMQVPRAKFAITVLHDRIYCMGGCDSIHELNSVEKYNPNTGMWHCVISMNVQRISPSAVTVKIPKCPAEFP